MCQIVDTETYLNCGHEVLCHLKYDFRYCKAPDGIPFANPEAWDRKTIYPHRFCKEEDWVSMTMKFEGSCKNCRRERRERKKERKERERYGDGYNDGGLSEAERRERDDRDVEDEYLSSYDSNDSNPDSDSDSGSEIMYLGEEHKKPAGVMNIYTGCDCSHVFYEGGKLQGCFEKKPSFTQVVEGGPRGTKRRHSPDIGDPDQTREILNTPTPPPNMDTELSKAHRAAEGEEFSIKERDLLACSRDYRPRMCANCERKEIVAEVRTMRHLVVKGRGFRQRKPTGLWIFPSLGEKVK